MSSKLGVVVFNMREQLDDFGFTHTLPLIWPIILLLPSVVFFSFSP
jgi:hypothetical protein